MKTAMSVSALGLIAWAMGQFGADPVTAMMANTLSFGLGVAFARCKTLGSLARGCE